MMDPARQLATMLATPSIAMQQQQLELQRWMAQQAADSRSSGNKWNALGMLGGGLLGGGSGGLLGGLFS